MEKTLIKNADWLVTVDPRRRIIRNGALLIEGRHIAEVGKSEEIDEWPAADTVIDAQGMLVMPGLVDTHVHNSQQCGRGLADEADIPVHLLQRLYGYEKELSEEDAYWAALACQVELIRAGTTSFVDPGSYFPEQTARAVGESGLRGIIARTAFDVHNTPIGGLPERMSRETTEQALERGQDTVARLHGAHDGRLQAWFALRILSGCSDRLILETRRLADSMGVGVVAHASESRDEVVASRITYGKSDVERLGALGALSPNTILIHMGWASPKEITLCKSNDLKVSCTPSTGYRLGMGSMEHGRFAEMLELGITVALGSDAAMSSNYLDIVREMFLAAGGAKSARLDPTIMPPEVLIEMGTINGAKASLWDTETGALERGRRADIAMFETRRPEWRPIINPIANLVYSSRGGADTVIVDGNVLLQSGKLLHLDEDNILDECQTRGEAIAERSGLGATVRPSWPID